MTNGGWRRDECRSGVRHARVGPEVGNSSFHSGHSSSYTVSTYITYTIIKDRPGKPAATLVKELPCSLFWLLSLSPADLRDPEVQLSPQGFIFYLCEILLRVISIHLGGGRGAEGLPA